MMSPAGTANPTGSPLALAAFCEPEPATTSPVQNPFLASGCSVPQLRAPAVQYAHVHTMALRDLLTHAPGLSASRTIRRYQPSSCRELACMIGYGPILNVCSTPSILPSRTVSVLLLRRAHLHTRA